MFYDVTGGGGTCLFRVHFVQLVNKPFLYLYDCGLKFISFIMRCHQAFTFPLALERMCLYIVFGM